MGRHSRHLVVPATEVYSSSTPPLLSNTAFVRYGISHALSSCLDLLACLFARFVVCLSVVLQVGVVKVVLSSFDHCESSKEYKLEGIGWPMNQILGISSQKRLMCTRASRWVHKIENASESFKHESASSIGNEL